MKRVNQDLLFYFILYSKEEGRVESKEPAHRDPKR